MKTAGLGAMALEARRALGVVRETEAHVSVGALVVGGTLAPQLARELGAGAAPGAVVVRDSPTADGAEVVVRILAGDPGEADAALVRDADRQGVPVVLVQLWPQANWSALFVLTPFVVECRAGEGFPVRVIAETISRAAAHPEALAAQVPVLEEPVESSAVRTAVARAALLGVTGSRKGSARPLITLEQLRMLSSLRTAEGAPARPELPPAAVAAATVAASFALRAVARTASRSLPAPLVNAAVAAGGTWALAKALEFLQDREQGA